MSMALRGLLLWAVWSAWASPAHADPSPSERLSLARDAFRRSQCGEVTPNLTDVLYPEPKLAREQDLVEARVLLGACRLLSGDEAAATREFEEALFLDRALELDPMLFSRDVIARFTATKRALEDRERRDAEQRELAAERERYRKFRESLMVYERRSFAVNFVPLGAGQFQNGHRKKGVAFFAGQAITGAASAAIFSYLTARYGIGGRVPEDEARTVQRLQGIEIATGATFFALYGWSVVDALVHFKPQVKVKADDSLLRDAVPPPLAPSQTPKGLRKDQPKTSPKQSFLIMPVVVEDTAGNPQVGIGLRWER